MQPHTCFISLLFIYSLLFISTFFVTVVQWYHFHFYFFCHSNSFFSILAQHDIYYSWKIIFCEYSIYRWWWRGCGLYKTVTQPSPTSRDIMTMKPTITQKDESLPFPLHNKTNTCPILQLPQKLSIEHNSTSGASDKTFSPLERGCPPLRGKKWEKEIEICALIQRCSLFGEPLTLGPTIALRDKVWCRPEVHTWMFSVSLWLVHSPGMWLWDDVVRNHKHHCPCRKRQSIREERLCQLEATHIHTVTTHTIHRNSL